MTWDETHFQAYGLLLPPLSQQTPSRIRIKKLLNANQGEPWGHSSGRKLHGRRRSQHRSPESPGGRTKGGRMDTFLTAAANQRRQPRARLDQWSVSVEDSLVFFLIILTQDEAKVEDHAPIAHKKQPQFWCLRHLPTILDHMMLAYLRSNQWSIQIKAVYSEWQQFSRVFR